MRVTFLSREEYPSYREDVCTLIEKELADKCHVTFFARKGFSNDRKTTSADYKLVQGVNKATKFNFLNKFIQFFLILSCILHTVIKRPNYLIVRDDPLALALSLVFCSFSKVKICYWMSFLNGEMQLEQAALSKNPVRTLLARATVFLENIGLSKVKYVVSQSEQMKTYLEEKFSFSDDVQVLALPMGVDMNKVDEFRNKNIDCQVNVNQICYLGSLDVSRNISFLLEVVEILKENNPLIKLVLVGGSVSKANELNIQNEITTRGLRDSVEITGHLERFDAWKFALNSMVCLSYIPRTKYFDVSSPTKMAEYLALGKQVVASDIPDQAVLAEMVDVDCIVKNSVNEYVFKIQSLMDGCEKQSVDVNSLINARSYKKLGGVLHTWLGEY